MEWIFAGLLVAGLVWLVLMIAAGLGDLFNIDGALETVGLTWLLGIDADDASGMGCGVIAAFMAGTGAFGLAGLGAGLAPLVTLIAALVFGFALARLIALVLRGVLRGQRRVTFAVTDLIGQRARITVGGGGGALAEALVEAETLLKYPARTADDAPLVHGDQVIIVGVEGGVLLVEKA